MLWRTAAALAALQLLTLLVELAALGSMRSLGFMLACACEQLGLEHPDVTLPLELHRDTTLGFDCRPVRSGDEVVCMPGNPEGSTRVFADAECTVLATLGGSCEPYPHVLTPSCGGHSSLAAIYRATHPIERVWYVDEWGECVELEDAVALDAYALEEIPLDSLARFTRELR